MPPKRSTRSSRSSRRKAKEESPEPEDTEESMEVSEETGEDESGTTTEEDDRKGEVPKKSSRKVDEAAASVESMPLETTEVVVQKESGDIDEAMETEPAKEAEVPTMVEITEPKEEEKFEMKIQESPTKRVISDEIEAVSKEKLDDEPPTKKMKKLDEEPPTKKIEPEEQVVDNEEMIEKREEMPAEEIPEKSEEKTKKEEVPEKIEEKVEVLEKVPEKKEENVEMLEKTPEKRKREEKVENQEGTPEKREKKSEKREQTPEKRKEKEEKREGTPEKREDKTEKKEGSPIENKEEKVVEKKAEKPVETEEQKKERKEKEKKEREEKAKAKELEKFWKAVKDNPSDFTGWTYLLQFADSLSNIDAGREAYDAFLLRYPYCYGYWKKFADFEKKKGTVEKCMMVFERGIQAIPLSTDLWVHYLNHVKAAPEYKDNKEFIRTQYERAVEACGREWRSDKLWDHYVKFETDSKNLQNVFKLYQRILKNPTQGLSHQFEMYRDFVKDNNPKDIMEVNDFLALRKEILSSLKGDEDKKDAKKDGEKPNGDVKEADKEEGAPGEDIEGTKSDEETLAIREKIIFSQRKIYKETEEKVNARWKYEEGIKRPYFHVKPLERGQLKNWHDYIDFTKKNAAKEGGDITEVEILYERCLIACALYEEFWMKYVSWFEKREGDFTEKIRNVLHRACTYHLPSKVDIHMRWAAFEESNGNYDKAGEILANIEKQHPELISLLLSRINLERRRGNFDKVVELYEACVKSAKNQVTASDLSVRLSRFVRLQLGNSAKAAEIVTNALELDNLNPKLYLQLLDILLHTSPIDTKAVVELFDKALGQDKLAPNHKFLFSQRKVEFLEDFGQDIKALQEAQAAHAALVKQNKGSAPKEPETAGGTTTPTGSGISTIEGRTGKKSSSNGSSYPPMTNSASYNASQNSAYNNYGSRYSQYPSNYNYNQYYQQQGGYQGNYGGGGNY